jgi:hypothetical protein
MIRTLAVLTIAASLAPSPAHAQSRPIAPGNTVLMAQYKCQADQLSRADALIREIAAPTLNKYVASGKLLTWGYVGVYIGDQANRSIYVWGSNPVALMQARAEYLPELNSNPKFAEFVRICGSATITLQDLVAGAPSAPKS